MYTGQCRKYVLASTYKVASDSDVEEYIDLIP